MWMLFLFSDHFTHNYKSRHWPWLAMIWACGLIAGKNRCNLFFFFFSLPPQSSTDSCVRNLWPSVFLKLRIANAFFEPPECRVWINCWGLGRLTSLQNDSTRRGVGWGVVEETDRSSLLFMNGRIRVYQGLVNMSVAVHV